MAISHEAVKLQEGIFSVRGTWMGNISLFPTRSFVLKNKKNSGILVIDTCGSGSGKIIADAVKNIGLNPADITGIALTHWHGDHTGGLAELVSLVSQCGGGPVRVFMHKDDRGIFLKQKAEFIKIHPSIKLPVYHKPGKAPDEKNYKLISLSNDPGENPLREWDVEFIHTPGHTPGHTSYLHNQSMSLFSGCGLSLFGNSTVGLVPVFYNREEQVESAHKLMGMEFDYLYPAHMNLRHDAIPLKARIPFKGKPALADRLTGTLPLFRYPRMK